MAPTHSHTCAHLPLLKRTPPILPPCDVASRHMHCWLLWHRAVDSELLLKVTAEPAYEHPGGSVLECTVVKSILFVWSIFSAAVWHSALVLTRLGTLWHMIIRWLGCVLVVDALRSPGRLDGDGRTVVRCNRVVTVHDLDLACGAWTLQYP